MSGDLGAKPGEVHDAAHDVLRFWFEDVPPEKRFARDEALDRTIAERFGALRERVVASDAAGWGNDPDTLLAAIILLDQFSRNIHRGTAGAFAADALALKLTKRAIILAWDDGLPVERRAFLYMPMMHSEDRAVQAKSLMWFERLGDEENLTYAREHEAVIARFGRFPSRNAALGRESTPEELDYLSQPDAGW
ncbi:DUF924 family protein [Sphingomonas sp.]|uniref:DUF924 family protein n=1 Tax=Sphingomonas sp. TaxID=28214 RepID=UPI003D6CF8C7